MARDYARSRRIGDEIQRTLSEIIRRDLKDPRLQYLTITAVEVSRDLSHANIFVSPLDPEGDPTPMLEALESASGFIRRQLGRSLTTRLTPQLHFARDESIEIGSRLTSLIDTVVEDDKQRHQESDDDQDD
jgi:ribosome-binding factor A